MPDHKWDVSRLSAGGRSALKRNAGIMMNAAGADALEGFYRALTSRPGRYEEKAWFAAMCMQCLWREEDHPQTRLFPEMLRAVYQNPDATDSSRKKCTAFLDISWDDDGFLLGKLCSLVRGMRAGNAAVMPDFDELADDLAHWNHPDRYVQRKWIRTICSASNQDNNNDENKEEEKENVD